MILQWGIYVIRHSSKPIESATPGVGPRVNCGLWVIISHQCRFINHNKWITVVTDIDSGEATCVRKKMNGGIRGANEHD